MFTSVSLLFWFPVISFWVLCMDNCGQLPPAENVSCLSHQFRTLTLTFCCEASSSCINTYPCLGKNIVCTIDRVTEMTQSNSNSIAHFTINFKIFSKNKLPFSTTSQNIFFLINWSQSITKWRFHPGVNSKRYSGSVSSWASPSSSVHWGFSASWKADPL